MKENDKKMNEKLWHNFMEIFDNKDNLKSYYNYYLAIVNWVRMNKKFFKKEVLERNRLDVLLELDPTVYIVDNPDFSLEMELSRIGQDVPASINNFAMRIGDTLFELVSIKSGSDCPKCIYDELRYIFTVNEITSEEKVALECNSCGWTEYIDGGKWNDGTVKAIPASKKDLMRFGIIKE